VIANSQTYLRFAPDGIHLDFGKHKGDHLCAVPLDYLRWILREITDEEDDHVAALREAARGELDRRRHEGVGTFDFEEDE
jgi:hypothetical protein